MRLYALQCFPVYRSILTYSAILFYSVSYMRLYALLDPIVFTCNYRAKMDFLDLARFMHGDQFLYNRQLSIVIFGNSSQFILVFIPI